MTGKRILIILFVMILIFAGVILVFVLNKGTVKKGGEANNSLTPTPVQSGGSGGGSAENSVRKQNFPDFSVGVPETMTATQESNTGGGNTLVMKPTGDNPKNVSITIQETDASLSSLEKQKQIFQALGHSSSNITVSGVPATKFTNQIPLSNGEKMMETVILLQKGNIVYQIRIAYQDSSQDQYLEDIYSAVVANFSAN